MKKIRYPTIHVISTCFVITWVCNLCYPMHQFNSTKKRVTTQGSSELSLTEARRKFDERLCQFKSNVALQKIKSRLDIARVIKNRILTAVKQKARIDSVSTLRVRLMNNQMFELMPSAHYGNVFLAVPAERLFKLYVNRFSAPISLTGLPRDCEADIRQFYCLQLKAYAEDILNNIKKGSVTNPGRIELYEYSLILPALVSYSVPDDNISEMLGHIQDVEMGCYLSHFSLRRLGHPELALRIAIQVSKLRQERFSATEWALEVNQYCIGDHRADLAENCLRTVANNLPSEDPNVVILRLKIAENFSRCGDNTRAAKECREIARDFPNSLLYGRVIYSYFVYLSRQSEVEKMLAEIDSILEKPQCQRYLPQLMYLKWWALRKTNQQIIAKQIGKHLIEDYGNNPCIAPVLLAHAADALSNQHYDQCRKLLVQLTRNLPLTSSAKRAQEILNRLGKE